MQKLLQTHVQGDASLLYRPVPLLPIHLPLQTGAGPNSATELRASGFPTLRHAPSLTATGSLLVWPITGEGSRDLGFIFVVVFWFSCSSQCWASLPHSQQRGGTCHPHPDTMGAGRRTLSHGTEGRAKERHLSL